MLPLIIPYPQIDPVLIELGPLAIRWYALAYIAGLVLGWRYIISMSRNEKLWRNAQDGKPPMTGPQVDDLLLFATLGVVLGGRIGYILFYGVVYYPDEYLQHPLRMLAIWQGGMSFHGGLIGVATALVWFCRSQKLNLLRVGDLAAAATPIGLFFGRIANFINGELYGRPSHAPWAMIFPADRLGIPRHPSQLYEATCEGLLIFLALRVLTHRTQALSRPGLVSGVFLALYGLARAFCEFFREPDNPIGHTGLTMGMLLSVPMWIGAAFLIRQALKDKTSPAKTQ